MLKATLTNNQLTITAQFGNQEEVDAWIQSGQFGKPERWVKDTTNNPMSIEDKASALEQREAIDENGNVCIEYRLPSQVQVTVEDITEQHAKQNALELLAGAMAFGDNLIKEIAVENMAMGITQDGMTGIVRKAMGEAIMALITGSLYDAIEELRNIPEEKKDAKYITNARLLASINKIESYLGIPNSNSLN